MATLFTKTERGRPVRMLQVLVPGSGQRTLRLGSLPPRAAERLRDKVEALVACRRLNQTPDPEVVALLAGLADDVYRSLARSGLVEPREPLNAVPTLGAFIEKYISQRAGEISPRSIELLEQTAERLNEHFGALTPLDRITPDGAADWRGAMLSDGLSEATTRLHTRNAKSMFNAAVDRELLARNPFRKLPSAAIAANRDHYVSVEDAERVLATLPDHDWRVLFGLARYAGLRVASETHILTWDHVDLEGCRLSVYAPKTGHTRTVPIVPRLAELLQEAYERREAGYDELLTLTTKQHAPDGSGGNQGRRAQALARLVPDAAPLVRDGLRVDVPAARRGRVARPLPHRRRPARPADPGRDARRGGGLRAEQRAAPGAAASPRTASHRPANGRWPD